MNNNPCFNCGYRWYDEDLGYETCHCGRPVKRRMKPTGSKENCRNGKTKKANRGGIRK